MGADQRDPAATPALTPLGLPNRDPEPQILQPPPLEPIPAAENDMAPASPVDPTVTTPHDTFYLEDGNVEVLCGNTLFRVHTSILSFHSLTLRRMFAPPTLATAESPNGCPRISSTDTARDFATLLEMIYLPGYAALPRSMNCFIQSFFADSLDETEHHILVPPQNHSRVSAARHPIPAARGRP